MYFLWTTVYMHRTSVSYTQIKIWCTIQIIPSWLKYELRYAHLLKAYLHPKHTIQLQCFIQVTCFTLLKKLVLTAQTN